MIRLAIIVKCCLNYKQPFLIDKNRFVHQRKSMVMYICVRSIQLCFHDFLIGLWNCSESCVVSFSLYLLLFILFFIICFHYYMHVFLLFENTVVQH
jgi:hypothetical protein